MINISTEIVRLNRVPIRRIPPANGKSRIPQRTGGTCRFECCFLSRLAVTWGNWMVKVTLVSEDPAGKRLGVMVPVAPGGSPLRLKVTGAGKVAPLDGPSARVYVAVPPGTTVSEVPLLPADPETLRLKSCTTSATAELVTETKSELPL